MSPSSDPVADATAAASQVWVIFQSLSPPASTHPHTFMLHAVKAEERPRDSSHTLLHPGSEGRLKTPVPCALPCNETSTFSLTKVVVPPISSLVPTDGAPTSISPSAPTPEVPSRFSIDTSTLTADDGIEHEVSTDDTRYTLTFTVSSTEPAPRDGLVLSLDEDLIDIIQEDTTSVSPTPISDITAAVTAIESPSSTPRHRQNSNNNNAVSFQFVDDEDEHEYEQDDITWLDEDFENSPVDFTHYSVLKSSRRIRFSSRTTRIPTTETLHAQLRRANADRAQLWNALTDVSTQLDSLKRSLKYYHGAGALSSVSTSTIASSSTLSIPNANSSTLSIPSATDSAPSTPTKPPRCPSTPTGAASISAPIWSVVVLDGDCIGTFHGKAFDVQLVAAAVRHLRGRRIVLFLSKQHATDIDLITQDESVSVCISPFAADKRAAFIVSYAMDRDAAVVSNSLTAALDDAQGLSDSALVRFVFVGKDFVPDRAKLPPLPMAMPMSTPLPMPLSQQHEPKEREQESNQHGVTCKLFLDGIGGDTDDVYPGSKMDIAGRLGSGKLDATTVKRCGTL